MRVFIGSTNCVLTYTIFEGALRRLFVETPFIADMCCFQPPPPEDDLLNGLMIQGSSQVNTDSKKPGKPKVRFTVHVFLHRWCCASGMY